MLRDEVLVADILRYARQAGRAGAGVTAEQLEADPDRQAMVLWPLTVLGEAASTPGFPGSASLASVTSWCTTIRAWTCLRSQKCFERIYPS